MSTATQPIGVIARLLDLSERRIQQLSREGVIPKAERGQYDLIGSVRGYVRYLRDQAVRAQAGAPDYAAERARFIRARADLAEMEAEEKRAALIPADQVEATAAELAAKLAARAPNSIRKTCNWARKRPVPAWLRPRRKPRRRLPITSALSSSSRRASSALRSWSATTP